MGTKTHPLPEERFGEYLALLNSITSGRDLPHAACCAFLIGTGARIGEALTCRVCDLFNSDGSPRDRVTRNVEKARADKRITVGFPWEYIGRPILAWRDWAIRHRAITPEDYLFAVAWNGSRLCRVSFWRGNRRLLQRIGIPWGGIGLHGLRKTILRKILSDQTASGRSWIEAMRYCQEFAGHQRLDTTIRYLVDDPADDPAMWGRILVTESATSTITGGGQYESTRANFRNTQSPQAAR